VQWARRSRSTQELWANSVEVEEYFVRIHDATIQKIIKQSLGGIGSLVLRTNQMELSVTAPVPARFEILPLFSCPLGINSAEYGYSTFISPSSFVRRIALIVRSTLYIRTDRPYLTSNCRGGPEVGFWEVVGTNLLRTGVQGFVYELFNRVFTFLAHGHSSPRRLSLRLAWLGWAG
jgi:hypothetical protein